MILSQITFLPLRCTYFFLQRLQVKQAKFYDPLSEQKTHKNQLKHTIVDRSVFKLVFCEFWYVGFLWVLVCWFFCGFWYVGFLWVLVCWFLWVFSVFNSVLTKLVKKPTLNTEKTNIPKLTKNQHTETHKKPTYQNSQKTNLPKPTFM